MNLRDFYRVKLTADGIALWKIFCKKQNNDKKLMGQLEEDGMLEAQFFHIWNALGYAPTYMVFAHNEFEWIASGTDIENA